MFNECFYLCKLVV